MIWPMRTSWDGELVDGQQMFLNLGTGRGFSVKEIIRAAEAGDGKKVPVVMGPRRPGDAVALLCDPTRAKKMLGWEAKIKEPKAIIQSAWNCLRIIRADMLNKLRSVATLGLWTTIQSGLRSGWNGRDPGGDCIAAGSMFLSCSGRR